MIGIPKTIATKRDFENLHSLALSNGIDRKEWLEKIKEMSSETTFQINVLEKTETGFIVPLIDLPTEYQSVSEKIKYQDSEDFNAWSVSKVIEEDFITISKGYLELEKLGISYDYVQTKIEELN